MTLTLETDTSACEISTTDLDGLEPDAVHALIQAVRLLAEGVPDTGARWPSEPRGHFIDLSHGWRGQAGIAVHPFADDWLDTSLNHTPGTWTPRRGPALFTATTTLPALVRAFTEAFGAARAGYVNHDRPRFGPYWRYPFPEQEFARLQAAGAALADAT
ncbi:hypothetical protein BIV57_16350 [Mangrovactinospora gilvigrisea]|uniref:Uncharacterized protein n=1 Tax=Mangrovactinospora gilvigrisea TaxID=1428644 RepID=A0A1J7C4F6_9ACTN|nr:hypothetical protein [Mangrovactinospora gilvigrisea]OIV36432.1 hypothetical protein BIV57_16350 [Mangrovactinospora gilvigrisea]